MAPGFCRGKSKDNWTLNTRQSKELEREPVNEDLPYQYDRFAGRFRPIICCMEVVVNNKNVKKTADLVWDEITKERVEYKASEVCYHFWYFGTSFSVLIRFL